MFETAKWVVDKLATILGAALLAHWFTVRREKNKRQDEDVRTAQRLRRRLKAELHLALMSLDRLMGQLDPSNYKAGDCRREMADLSDSLTPLIAAQEEMDVLGAPELVRDFADWLRRTRILIEEGKNSDLGDPSNFVAVNEHVYRSEMPPARAEVRRRFFELQVNGNQLLERINASDRDAR